MKFGDTGGCGFALGMAILNTLTFIYDILTLPVYYFIQNPSRKLRKAKEKRAAVVDKNETSITYKSLKKPTRYHLELHKANIDTLAKIFSYCSQQYGNKNCLGTRQILGEIDELQPNGKIFKKFQMGNYKWKTCKEVDEEASSFGRGLRELGIHRGDKVVIFCETRAEWMIAAHGLFKQHMVLVTIYATLGNDGIIHAINETEATAVITSAELLPKFSQILEKTPNVKTIIYFEEQLKKFENPEKISERVVFQNYDEVLKKGIDSKVVTVAPTPDDAAIIMYTSGSTGLPKGVVLTHKNLVGTLQGFCDATDIFEEDLMMGFLPLAHVFELLVENVCIFMGVKIGYSTPLTMLDTSSKIMKGFKGDATTLKPTFMTSVPLILDRIANGVQDKVAKMKFTVRLLFNFGYRYKLRWTRRGFSTPIVDKIIFGKVRNLVGGRIRLIIAGGAPLTPETHELVKICLCTTLSQGYGLTESTSGTSVQDEYDTSYGRVGPPLTGIFIRLVNWDEGNYTVKDKPYPRGEIVIGGDNVSEGYYKLPDKTNDDFFTENNKRWFKTGDIGEIHADGVLKIIDRKKDLVKLQMGEYISLGKVESALKTSPLIDNICVCGDSTKNFCVALIAPHVDNLEAFAATKGIKTTNFEELCDDQTVIKEVLREIANYAKQVKLEKYEIPAAITLVKEVWAPETGLITTTFKLKRKQIEDYYKDAIKKMYA